MWGTSVEVLYVYSRAIIARLHAAAFCSVPPCLLLEFKLCIEAAGMYVWIIP
jgi:hypothetical protein